MAAISGNSVAAAAATAVLSTHPRTIPLTMITTRKSNHGFAGLHFAALQATGALLLNFSHV